MKIHSYRVRLHPEPEGGFTVTVPTLTGCVTFGDTIEEAMKMAREALELYLESLNLSGEDILKESDFKIKQN